MVKPEAHPPCPISYYKEALTYFKDDTPVLVFSDDIEWCKEQELFQRENFIFNETIPDGVSKAFYDLCLISSCKDYIIANRLYKKRLEELIKKLKDLDPLELQNYI